jgi:hypothetical protein
MEIALKTFRVTPGKSVDLKKRKTKVKPAYRSKGITRRSWPIMSRA